MTCGALGRAAIASALAAACAWPVVAAGDPMRVVPSYVPRVHPPGPGARAVTPADDGADYYYVAFGEETPMAGAGAMITQDEPLVSTQDFHSLAEISVEDGSGQQIVEIGWNVDPGVNPGSVDTHLFSFHWIDGVGTCYNACGWVQVSATHSPGMLVPADKQPHSFQIEHRDDARWWLTYDGDDMGYYPDTEWQGRYTEAGFTQWFGEVAAGSETAPCTEMGDGMAGSSSPIAAKYAGIYTIGSGSARVAGAVGQTAVTLPAAYTPGDVSGSGFRFGGFGIAGQSCQYDTDPPPDGPPVDDLPLVDAGNAEMGSGGGCCDTRGGGGGSALVAGALAAAVLRARRRHRDRRRRVHR